MRRSLLVLSITLAFATPAFPQSDVSRAAPEVASGAFVQNAGQWDPAVALQYRSGPGTAWFHDAGVVLDLAKYESVTSDEAERALGLMAERQARLVGRATLRLSFADGASVTPVGAQQRREKVHYLRGADPRRWVLGAPTFAALRYERVWPGTDVVFRTDGPWLAYDLHVAPGFRVRHIELQCEGTEGLDVDDDGTLRMRTTYGDVLQTAPRSFEITPAGERVPVPSRFVLRGGGRYGFEVDRIDPSRGLLIDPGIEWGTYLGDSNGRTLLFASAAVAGDVVTVAGATESPQLPAPWNSNPGAGGWDALVSVLDTGAGAAAPQWTALIGGSIDDVAFDVAFDSAMDRVTIVGMTDSPDFPCTANASQGTPGGLWDGLVATFDLATGTCVHSTYFGAAGDDRLAAVHAHASQLTVAGYSDSQQWLTTPACLQANNAGLFDVVAALIDPLQPPAGQVLAWTFLGGQGDEGLWITANPLSVNSDMIDVHVDGSNVATVLATSSSANYPVSANAHTPAFQGIRDMVVTRWSWANCALLYSTYWGGQDSDLPAKVHVDASGVVTLAGSGWLRQPFATGLPTTPGSFQPAPSRAQTDMYVARLNPALPPSQQLLYGSYVGRGGAAGGADEIYGLAVEPSSGIVIAAGGTSSANLPTTPGAPQPGFAPSVMGFALRLEAANNGLRDLHYLSYVGQTQAAGRTVLTDLILSPNGRVVTPGYSNCPNIPIPQTTSPQPALRGSLDGVVLRLDLLPTCVTAMGASTPACTPPSYMQVNSAPMASNAGFEFLCLQAPSNAPVVIAYGLPSPGLPWNCVTIYPVPIWVTVPYVARPTGLVRAPLPIPAGIGCPTGLAAQFFYLLPGPCNGCALGASDALGF